MPVIKIRVRNKVPKVISQIPLPEEWKDPRFVVCYNGWDEDTYTVEWDLDEEWGKFEHLTMHVSFPDDTSTDVLFKGNTCTLPPILSPGNTYIGLYAGNIHSTIPAKLCAMRSTLSKGGFPPKTDAYLDVLKELEGKLDRQQGSENADKVMTVDEDGAIKPKHIDRLPKMGSWTNAEILSNDGENSFWTMPRPRNIPSDGYHQKNMFDDSYANGYVGFPFCADGYVFGGITSNDSEQVKTLLGDSLDHGVVWGMTYQSEWFPPHSARFITGDGRSFYFSGGILTEKRSSQVIQLGIQDLEASNPGNLCLKNPEYVFKFETWIENEVLLYADIGKVSEALPFTPTAKYIPLSHVNKSDDGIELVFAVSESYPNTSFSSDPPVSYGYFEITIWCSTPYNTKSVEIFVDNTYLEPLPVTNVYLTVKNGTYTLNGWLEQGLFNFVVMYGGSGVNLVVNGIPYTFVMVDGVGHGQTIIWSNGIEDYRLSNYSGEPVPFVWSHKTRLVDRVDDQSTENDIPSAEAVYNTMPLFINADETETSGQLLLDKSLSEVYLELSRRVVIIRGNSGRYYDYKWFHIQTRSVFNSVFPYFCSFHIDQDGGIGTYSIGYLNGNEVNGKALFIIEKTTPLLWPIAKTDAMTQPVGIDSNTGELYTQPSSDKSLGVTSATVGQILQVSEVDADGKPTKWDVLDTTEATLVEAIEGQVAAQTAEVT